MENRQYCAEQADKRMGEKHIVLLSFRPNFLPEERIKQKESIETILFEVFSRYEKRQLASTLIGAR